MTISKYFIIMSIIMGVLTFLMSLVVLFIYPEYITAVPTILSVSLMWTCISIILVVMDYGFNILIKE